ncbi:hypothetical protein [Pseudokineococcus sp. 1T1Z-3]|uniref:hypothetical protein n=1 Tax=Pseudokineococcus sp. 1T1Z-3 TaxID=3132745 RepID=UPI0030A86844
MAYGLASSPVLGFDLVRQPAGVQVARVLRYAVGAGAEHVAALAHLWGPGAAERADELARRQQARGPRRGGAPSLGLARVLLEAGAADEARQLLETSPVLPVEDLRGLVADVVVPQCWAVPTALHPRGDGADVLPPAVREDAASAVALALLEATTGGAPGGEGGREGGVLAAATRLAPPASGRVTAAAAGAPAAAALLGRLSRATRPELERLCGAVLAPSDASPARGTPAPPGAWAEQVHRASWRLEELGRTEAAACLQLDAVGLARDAGLDAALAARGAWQALSGALHAVLADAEPGLVAAWSAVMGAPTSAPGLPRPRRAP